MMAQMREELLGEGLKGLDSVEVHHAVYDEMETTGTIDDLHDCLQGLIALRIRPYFAER